MYCAPEVHIEQSPNIIDRDHFSFSHDIYSARVIEDDVQSSKDLFCSRKRMINVGLVGDVEFEHEQFVFRVARRETLEHLGLPEGRNDDFALIQEKLGQGSSEPR